VIEDIVLSIEEKFGKGAVLPASEAKGLVIRKFSTGSIVLDYALKGGWPKGKIVEILGAESSGKSTLALIASGEFQKEHPSGVVVYLDLEGTLDKAWALQLGVDLERLYVADNTHLVGGEDAGDFLVRWMEAGKDSGEPTLFVLDSISAAVPLREIEDEMGKAQVALHARLINKMLRKLLVGMRYDLSREEPPFTLILINQVRMKVGMPGYGNPYIGTGGQGRKFLASQRIYLVREGFVTYQTKVEEKTVKRSIGIKVKFRVEKNKTGGQMGEVGVFSLYTQKRGSLLPGMIDNGKEIIPLLKDLELIEKKKGKLIWDGVPFSERKLTEHFRTSRESLQRARSVLLGEIGQSPGPSQEKKAKRTSKKSPQKGKPLKFKH